MTDFLTRLVTATYGAAPILRPRPVAPYEPMATPPLLRPEAIEAAPVTPGERTDRATPLAALASTPDSPITSRTPAPADSVTSVPPRPQPATRDDRLAPSPTDQGRSHNSLPARVEAAQGNLPHPSAPRAHHGQQPASVDVAPPVHSSASLSSRQRLAVEPASNSSHQSNVQSQPAPIHAAASPLRAVATPAAATPQPTGGNAPASTPLHAPPFTSSPLASTGADALAPRRSAMAAEEEPAATRRLALPLARDRSEQEQRAPVARAEGDLTPAPIVRVTIGRIVLQAAPSAPARAVAARMSQPAAPALSLDQYLKGRNGGEA